MKTTRVLTIVFAAAGLLALAAPAEAQRRGGGNRGGGPAHGGNWHGGNWHGHGHGHGHGGVNVFFAPYWGWGWGYGYWGYPYGYWGYPYGWGYPAAPYFSYDPQGVYQGRLANPPQQQGDAKDFSMATRVQRQLAARGYYHGEIDGVIGEGTRSAIRRYQRNNGLQVDGEIGPEVLQSMGLG